LVWQGQGSYDGHTIAGADPNQDELLVSHARATVPHRVDNIGGEDLVLIKIFGPDINPQAPRIPKYPPE
jgi:hypothetical protein